MLAAEERASKDTRMREAGRTNAGGPTVLTLLVLLEHQLNWVPVAQKTLPHLTLIQAAKGLPEQVLKEQGRGGKGRDVPLKSPPPPAVAAPHLPPPTSMSITTLQHPSQ